MKPKLKELSFNPLMKSEEVIRYSGTYQAQPESLAVHVCDTSMLAYMIAVHLNSYGEGLNLGLLLEKCLLQFLRLIKKGLFRLTQTFLVSLYP